MTRTVALKLATNTGENPVALVKKGAAAIDADAGAKWPSDKSAPATGYCLDIGIHDTTRVEWVASAPLAKPGQRRNYAVELTVDVPEHLWVKHPLWEAFRARTRLQTPDRAVRATQARSVIDDIRHEALLGGRRLKRLERLVRLVIAREEDASAAIERLVNDIQARRAIVLRTGDGGTEGVRVEASLAAEYLSVAMLSTFARLRDTLPADSPGLARLTAAIVTERAYRREQGWPTPRGEGRKGLERWLRRRSALKKHFHQLLWLDADGFKPDDRLGHWIAAFVAIVASSWAFAWHVAYMNQLITGGMSMVTMIMAGAVAGVLYAVKDRIKEIGRGWLTRRVRDGIADKVVRLHLQRRIDRARGRLLISRENLRAEQVMRHDPLNPALGKTVSVVALTVSMRLEQHGLAVPNDWGVGGVKHVMRYDLSALFPRLDHGRRDVPVTRSDGRVHMASIRKLYGLHVRCTLHDESSGAALVREGELLIDRGGLRRLRMAEPEGTHPVGDMSDSKL
ncbi:MAG: hypothetical protein KC502_09320 [Myxococcales bacterium]|nr:hypothetical protein [Myxococcales bacterium]